jgi:hypothetical protein
MKHDLHLSPTDRDHKWVYIQELYHYECNETEGKFEFNGYYYVEDSDLPKDHDLCYTRYGEDGEVERNFYIVQIYKREEIEDTSVFTPTKKPDPPTEIDTKPVNVDDDDDEEWWDGVCFFPTKRQVLYFRVIVKAKEDDE